MTKKKTPPKQDQLAPGVLLPTLAVPDKFIEMTADLKESANYACGELRVAAQGKTLQYDQRVIVTERCYDAAPGASCKLSLRFFDGNSKVKPKGELVVETSRGKLSPVRTKLDGKKANVEVAFQAPDETIKVSIRAYLDGFHRGKIHLHLE